MAGLFNKIVRRQRRMSATGGRRPVPHVLVGGVEKKSCSRCGSLKPLSEYGVKNDAKDGLRSECKECSTEMTATTTL